MDFSITSIFAEITSTIHFPTNGIYMLNFRGNEGYISSKVNNPSIWSNLKISSRNQDFLSWSKFKIQPTKNINRTNEFRVKKHADLFQRLITTESNSAYHQKHSFLLPLQHPGDEKENKNRGKQTSNRSVGRQNSMAGKLPLILGLLWIRTSTPIDSMNATTEDDTDWGFVHFCSISTNKKKTGKSLLDEG